MGKFSREKGGRGERLVISMLQPVVSEVFESFDRDAPKLQRNLLQSDDGGCDIAGLEWLSLEVKNAKTLKIPEWWRQTLQQAGRTKVPVLFYNVGPGQWRVRMLVAMPLHTGRALMVGANVDLPDFLVWFRARLSQELAK